MALFNALTYLNDNISFVTDLGQITGINMPLYLKNEFMFHRVEVLDRRFILAEFLNSESVTIDRIKNRKSKIKEFFEKDESIVFVFNDTNDYQRRRLIEERISFIISGKMIYILELGTIYSEKANTKYNRQVNMKNEQMKPATQSLLIYLLRTQNFDSSMSEIAGEISVSTMSVSRAFHELVQFEIVKVNYNEEKEQYSLNGSRKEVWEKALPYMSNPVIKTVFIDHDSVTNRQFELLKISGESALSRYSMLSAPSEEVLGVHKKDFKDNFNNVRLLPIKEIDSLVVQIFNHTLYSKDDALDELSTALVLIDNPDERVKGQVDRMLAEYFGEEVTNGKK